ncbi:MAG: DUF3575 domain-containing protein [Rikenellaceae bacterium]
MKEVINTLTLLLLCVPLFGQTGEKGNDAEILFYHNSYEINLDYGQNQEAFDALVEQITTLQKDSMSTIHKIVIDSYTSPEGGRQLNDRLSINRTNSLYDYLVNIISVPDSIIVKQHTATDWDKLHRMVSSSDMEYKDEVLDILDNVPEETWRRVNPSDRWLTLVDSRNKRIAELQHGEVYRDLFYNIYPQLRRGKVVTIYFQTVVSPVVAEQLEALATTTVDVAPVAIPVVAPKFEPTIEYIRKPILAVKTNLLFDLATVLNVGIEVPIGDRFSVMGEWTFPWWIWDDGTPDSKRHRLQLLYGNIEGRYWFGSRADKPKLTGWYAGIYSGGGKYDFEYNRKGVQGEFFVAAGLSTGFAHSINKSNSLRMEYSVSAGILKTDYRDYTAIYGDGYDFNWHPIRKSTGEYTYIGPTALRVSLVWMFHYNKQKKGGAR